MSSFYHRSYFPQCCVICINAYSTKLFEASDSSVNSVTASVQRKLPENYCSAPRTISSIRRSESVMVVFHTNCTVIEITKKKPNTITPLMFHICNRPALSPLAWNCGNEANVQLCQKHCKWSWCKVHGGSVIAYYFGLAWINARCPPKPLHHSFFSAGQGRGNITESQNGRGWKGPL